MNCILNPTEQEELLLGYCSGSLPLETARSYERHLKTCEHCRALVDMQRMVDESLDDWQAPAPSADFDHKLFARIRLEESSKVAWWRQVLPSGFGWKPLVPVALAAAALVVFLVRTPDTPHVGDTIRAEEIEQVERALDDLEALQALHQPDSDAVTKESL